MNDSIQGRIPGKCRPAPGVRRTRAVTPGVARQRNHASVTPMKKARPKTSLEEGSARGGALKVDPAMPGRDQKLWTTPRLNALVPVPASVALPTVKAAPFWFWMRPNAV